MFKRTHVKTITAFLVIGLIIITGLGMLNILNLEDIKDQTIDSNINFEQKISDVRKLTVALDIGYAILCLIASFIFFKCTSLPSSFKVPEIPVP